MPAVEGHETGKSRRQRDGETSRPSAKVYDAVIRERAMFSSPKSRRAWKHAQESLLIRYLVWQVRDGFGSTEFHVLRSRLDGIGSALRWGITLIIHCRGFSGFRKSYPEHNMTGKLERPVHSIVMPTAILEEHEIPFTAHKRTTPHRREDRDTVRGDRQRRRKSSCSEEYHRAIPSISSQVCLRRPSYRGSGVHRTTDKLESPGLLFFPVYAGNARVDTMTALDEWEQSGRCRDGAKGGEKGKKPTKPRKPKPQRGIPVQLFGQSQLALPGRPSALGLGYRRSYLRLLFKR